MKVKHWWYAGVAAATLVAVAGYALMLSQRRVIRVRVYSDYSFRMQHSNWPDLLESRFRDAALIFQRSGAGVKWKVLGSNDTDPTSDMATLDGRRNVLPELGDNKAAVLVSFTGLHEGDRIGSTNPFSRAVMVVDFPDRPESANAIILAGNLAHMFAAPVDAAWVQSASAGAPQSVRLPPRVVTLIHQLRRYNFAAGVDGLLEGRWAQRAADAIAQADTTPNSNPAAHGQQVVGIALLNDRRRDAAVVHLREATRIDPKSVSLHVETALALSRNGQDADALAELAEAIRLEPNSAVLHQSLASLLVKMRRPEEATEEITMAARLDPKNASCYNSRAWLWATCPVAKYRDGKNAVESARKALEINETKTGYKETLAAAYAEVGDFEGAVRLQEQALQDPQFRNDEGSRRRLELYRKKMPYRDE